MTAPEPYRTTIEGKVALVFERVSPLAPTLQLLLAGGRDAAGRTWLPLRVTHREPLRLRGARHECDEQRHRPAPWLEGFSTGRDGVVRYVVLAACQDCGAVRVNDRSFDTLQGLPTGRQPIRRRDKTVGWYSGGRPGQREYR